MFENIKKKFINWVFENIKQTNEFHNFITETMVDKVRYKNMLDDEIEKGLFKAFNIERHDVLSSTEDYRYHWNRYVHEIVERILDRKTQLHIYPIKNEIKEVVEEYVKSEKFIDEFVQRIKRKQLGE